MQALYQHKKNAYPVKTAEDICLKIFVSPNKSIVQFLTIDLFESTIQIETKCTDASVVNTTIQLPP